MDDQEEPAGDTTVEKVANNKQFEGTKLTETKRVSRNMNEKRRRDLFNVLISELAAVISPSNRSCKYEKVTVLKEAIACLRNQKDSTHASSHRVKQPHNNWQTTLVGGSELSQIVLDAMNGFVLSLDCSGIITFASESILSALGYRSKDMINNSIADFLDQSDRSSIFALLQKQEKNLPPPASNLTGKSSTIGKTLVFQMNLNYGPHEDKKGYVTIKCCGQYFTMSHNNPTPVTSGHENPQTTKLQLIVVGSLRFPKPNIMIPLSNTQAKEFTSRLTLDWIYTFVDPRALLIVGYLPSELIKKSAYLFFHEEDLENVSSYHEMLVRKGRVNTCYYRFLTKGQSWVWLRSCCNVSYNQWNSKPEYVTSTTTSVSYDEVCSNQENLLQEDKLKFQNIYKKSDSESMKSVLNQVTPPATTLPQDDTLQNPNTSVATKVLNGYNYSDKLPLMDTIKSGTTLGIQSQGEDVGVDVGVDVESISSATSELDLTLSTMKAPDGLTPTQCKLHMQLQGKHKALKMSINHQIDELESIKKQIEINKQLWEFNKQLKEKKGSAMDRGIEGLNGIGAPTKRRGQSERSSGEDSNYEPHNKRLQANSEEISRSYQVEMPVSHYIDLPAISLGDTPSMLYGMDQPSTNFPSFANSIPHSSLSSQPGSYCQYYSQNGR